MVYGNPKVIESMDTKKRAEEHDKKYWHLIEPHIHNIGSLWVDSFGHYYIIKDVRLYPYEIPDFLIERVDNGDQSLASVKDFNEYHKFVS